MSRIPDRRRLVAAAAIAGLLIGTVTGPAAATAAPAPTVSDGPNFLHLPVPLSSAGCLAAYGVHCYSPAQLQAAYGIDTLLRHGVDGRGRTIVIPVPFGSPTIRHDLQVYDTQFHLPDPALSIVESGVIPPYDAADETRVEWAAGTTLAVEDAHALAPRARIVIAETAVSEDAGISGFPELLAAEDRLIKAGTGDVIVQIEGTPESTFPGYADGDYRSLLSLRGAFADAAARHVTVLAAAGNGGGGSARWPASDPLVTSVGGSRLYLDASGRRQRRDTAWDDGLGASGGGGLSEVFARPSYQRRVSGVVGNRRGVPDISMAASVDGGGWVYASFGGTGGVGWDLFDGTGQATALFGGVVALADQAAGRRLGLLDPALYRARSGIVDITAGSTGVNGSAGFTAGRGYDLATGLGTVDVPALTRSLAGGSRCRGV